jgi:hypothetical protein
MSGGAVMWLLLVAFFVGYQVGVWVRVRRMSAIHLKEMRENIMLRNTLGLGPQDEVKWPIGIVRRAGDTRKGTP